MKTVFTFSLLAFAACGSPDSHRPSPDAGPDAATIDSSPDGSGSIDPCSDAAKKVYVVDKDNTFSTFDPTTKMFHDVGTLGCPAADGATPFSMGIDRDAVAWVLYIDGELFRVDTTSLACTATQWQPTAGLPLFGMGFSSDTSGGNTDTLFVAGTATGPGSHSSALASIDTAAFAA